jgi:hypothetical protein
LMRRCLEDEVVARRSAWQWCRCATTLRGEHARWPCAPRSSLPCTSSVWQRIVRVCMPNVDAGEPRRGSRQLGCQWSKRLARQRDRPTVQDPIKALQARQQLMRPFVDSAKSASNPNLSPRCSCCAAVLALATTAERHRPAQAVSRTTPTAEWSTLLARSYLTL